MNILKKHKKLSRKGFLRRKGSRLSRLCLSLGSFAKTTFINAEKTPIVIYTRLNLTRLWLQCAHYGLVRFSMGAKIESN